MRIVYDMPSEEYFAIHALSASGAKLLNRSAAHYLADKATPRSPSPAMAFGSLVHTLILEPQTVDARYAAMPKINKRTNAGKEEAAEFEQANANKIIVDLDDFQRGQRTAAAVLAHPTARDLLNADGQSEATVLWEQHGVDCKARLDYLSENCIVDIKTARDASYDGFARACSMYSYHMQAAHYMAASEAMGKQRPFVFIVVEAQPPFNVAVYTLTAADLAAGREQMKRAAEVFKDLGSEKIWHGYPIGITPLALRWNGGSSEE